MAWLLVPCQIELEHHLLVDVRPSQAQPALVEEPPHGGEHSLSLSAGGRNTEIFPEPENYKVTGEIVGQNLT